MNNTQKCECIIGLLYNYTDTDLVTLAQLKEHIEREKSLAEIHKDSDWWQSQCNTYTLDVYCDRRKTTDLKRFYFCPRCGKKIDWKSMKEGAGE